jgi:peptidyl-prolyl cis-trans isomerase B (cyclophilin B)
VQNPRDLLCFIEARQQAGFLFLNSDFMNVIIDTNYGQIHLELDQENTPKTTENFLRYTQNNFYSNTIFHRVINNFMIQGGGFENDMTQKTDLLPPIKNEAKKAQSNKRGTIAMARTSDPHSATAQFFINIKDNDFLNFSSESSNGYGYCVFGYVTEGMEVVDKIKLVSTTSRAGHQDVPVEPVMINSVLVANTVTS